MAHLGLPRMSRPFQHVHIDLAGPFELCAVPDGSRRKKHGTTRTSLSTRVSGSGYVAMIIDYFTKAAKLVLSPNKQASTWAHAFHYFWLLRYGLPEWLTSDNGPPYPLTDSAIPVKHHYNMH
jgi:hypothetical protein